MTRPKRGLWPALSLRRVTGTFFAMRRRENRPLCTVTAKFSHRDPQE